MTMGCKTRADLLLFNGRIYTASKNPEVTEAMVIRKGLILASGDETLLRKKFGAAEEKNLDGNAVYPGFFDSHCHFYQFGLIRRQADLTGTHSPEEIGKRLWDHFKKNKNSWILGHGWDQNDWKDMRFPDRKVLDTLFPDIPVYLVRVDGHAAWVNSKALDLAGIHSEMNLEGGEVLCDENGPTGILIDHAMSLVERLIPSPSREEQIQALLSAEKSCLAAGLTSLSDAGLDQEIVLLIDSLHKEGLLSIHVNAMLNPTDENMNHFINHGIYVTDKLTVRSIKLYVDGALGSRGAMLKKPYTDDPKNSGIQITSTEVLKQICLLAYHKGYQINTHCIGDSAISLMLQIYTGILPENNDLRWRIEHAQVFDPQDLHLFRQYSIIPSVQTTHATSDMYWAEQRLGADRVVHAYAYKTLLDQNGWLPNGSDFPVESISPIFGFYAAVARKDLNGFPSEGYRTKESLTRFQALHAMTIWSAKACFAENEKGSLEPGKSADFVVLDQDIMTVDEKTIPRTRVLETYIGGRKISRE